LERVHDPAYLDLIAATAGRCVKLDEDTFTSGQTHEVALVAAGAAVLAMQHTLSSGESAFALVRPPGHHAERALAMGFCLYNNVAIAAAAALAQGLERVAIVDIDVHHGNGTQAIFYDEARVLFVSTHQYPFYPGTGAATEIGTGNGRGFTVNVPMEAGSTDADYALVHRAIVHPILHEYQPQLMLVSAGFDAHAHDPLGGMRLTTQGYAGVVQGLRRSVKNGALVLVTEGGYDLSALRACVAASLSALEDPFDPADVASPARTAPRGARAVAAARASLEPFWRML
jgi:acetoin utilization deacetylase AcuC-like enzyme